MTKSKTIVREYEKAIGKTITGFVDLTTPSEEGFRMEFSDGSFLIIRGNASGYDIEFDGIFYEFFEKNQTL